MDNVDRFASFPIIFQNRQYRPVTVPKYLPEGNRESPEEQEPDVQPEPEVQREPEVRLDPEIQPEQEVQPKPEIQQGRGVLPEPEVRGSRRATKTPPKQETLKKIGLLPNPLPPQSQRRRSETLGGSWRTATTLGGMIREVKLSRRGYLILFPYGIMTCLLLLRASMFRSRPYMGCLRLPSERHPRG